MKLLVCIDDTDNLDSKGTGAIADELKELITEQGIGTCGLTTRHQLLLHDEIPYTSHNSSMCFDCEAINGCFDKLVSILLEHLKKSSAIGSDPGIAVVKIDNITNQELLVQFGLDAKRKILSKALAYETADKAGIYLAEAGGTGLGIIGALAGVGLRLGGNDGEVKGGLKEFKKMHTYKVEALLNTEIIHAVCDTDGYELDKSAEVLVVWKAKPMLINNRFVLRVIKNELGAWSTMEKSEMREFGNQHAWNSTCALYSQDVLEELVNAPLRSCLNCRYRRWTGTGFLCVAL